MSYNFPSFDGFFDFFWVFFTIVAIIAVVIFIVVIYFIYRLLHQNVDYKRTGKQNIHDRSSPNPYIKKDKTKSKTSEKTEDKKPTIVCSMCGETIDRDSDYCTYCGEAVRK